jgi:hypothetical protein
MIQPFTLIASLHADEANRTTQLSELAVAGATGFEHASFLARESGEVVRIIGTFVRTTHRARLFA